MGTMKMGMRKRVDNYATKYGDVIILMFVLAILGKITE